MKDLDKLVLEVISDLEELGIDYGYVREVVINTRAKRRWGLCRHISKTHEFIIQISSSLLDDNLDDMSAKNTIAHEYLHTCKGCLNHGKEWLRYADMMNKAFGYNIKRTTSSEEKGVEYREVAHRRDTYNWSVICNHCGREFKYTRKNKVVKILLDDIEGYCTCPECKGKSFSVEKLR